MSADLTVTPSIARGTRGETLYHVGTANLRSRWTVAAGVRNAGTARERTTLLCNCSNGTNGRCAHVAAVAKYRGGEPA